MITNDWGLRWCVKELHETYYEPLAEVAPSLEALLAGAPVKKLLFMAPPVLVEAQLKPDWGRLLRGTGAEPMQVATCAPSYRLTD